MFIFLLFEITEIGGENVLFGFFSLPLIREVLLSKYFLLHNNYIHLVIYVLKFALEKGKNWSTVS